MVEETDSADRENQKDIRIVRRFEMTLEEAIVHAETRSKELADCKCAREHKQLAEWLKELHYLRKWKDAIQTDLKMLKDNVWEAGKKNERSKEILQLTDWR